MDTVVFTIGKNSYGLYRICVNVEYREYSYLNRYNRKDLFKEMEELTNLFKNEIGKGVLFEILIRD